MIDFGQILGDKVVVFCNDLFAEVVWRLQQPLNHDQDGFSVGITNIVFSDTIMDAVQKTLLDITRNMVPHAWSYSLTRDYKRSGFLLVVDP